MYDVIRYDEAVAAFEESLQQGADYDSYAYEGLGRTFAKLHRYQEALEAFDHALALDPDNQEVAMAKREILPNIE